VSVEKDGIGWNHDVPGAGPHEGRQPCENDGEKKAWFHPSPGRFWSISEERSNSTTPFLQKGVVMNPIFGISVYETKME
jgi:hypothetical protein